MKIEQDDDFRPITLTLETQEEAEAVWKAVAKGSIESELQSSRRTLISIDVWFCNLSNTVDISKDN